MGKVALPQWVLISVLVLGSLLFLLFYQKSADATGSTPSSKVLMAALEPSALRAGRLNSPVIPKAITKQGILVPLHQDERALMLEARLDNRKNVTMILDTGATYTTISRDLAEKLGYDLHNAPRVIITTANGQISLPRITLKSLTFNGYTAYNVDATVMNMPRNVPFAGLLGLSFVKHHRITIDYEAEHLVIEPKGV